MNVIVTTGIGKGGLSDMLVGITVLCGTLPIHDYVVELVPCDTMPIAFVGERTASRGVSGRGKISHMCAVNGSTFLPPYGVPVGN